MDGVSAWAAWLPGAIVIVAVTAAHRGIVCGRVLFFEDVAAYFEPLWTAVAAELRQGRLPGWALGAWSGQPLLGDPQLGVFYPPHYLWLFLAPVRCYALSVLDHGALAALGAFLLARALGRSRAAAAVAALALSLSAYFVLEARHIMFVASAAWVPWLLLAITRHARSGSARSVAAIAATSALALLAGGWSMLIFAAPIACVFAAARVARLGRARGRRALGILAGALLGVALAAVQLAPAIAHARLSPRALPLAQSFAGSYAWPSLRYATTLLFPLAYGDDARGTYTGAPDQWELCGYGAGLVAALLALASLRGRTRRRERLAYVGLVAGAMLFALGEHGPLARLLPYVPLLDRARCPARALFIYTLLVPLLAADGLDHLRALLPRRARAIVLLAPLAITLELLATFRAENPTVPLASTVIAPVAVAAIPRAPSDGRTLVDVHLGQAFHNGGLRWGIESPGGYSSLPLWRYLHLLWIGNHGRVYPGWPRPALAHDLTAQGLWALDSPIVDLLNVRWLLAPHDRPPAGSGWVLEDGATPDRIDRWRNDEALPRAFVVHAVDEVPDEAAAALAVAAADFDPARTAIVEEPIPPPIAGALDAAQLIDRAGADVRFRVRAATAGVLVLSEPFEPSWRARVDGHEVRVLRIDYALMGLPLPAGTHEIAFRRVDAPLRAGAAISIVALLIVGFLLLRRPAHSATL